MIGTFNAALDWALDHCSGDALDFLRAWREGDISDWPEYATWLGDQERELVQNGAPIQGAGRVVYYHEVEAAEAEVEIAKQAYLRRWGWKQTCSTPGSYWLWSRDFADYDAKFDAFYATHPDKPRPVPTGTLKLPIDLAVSMTARALDERPELGDGED
jgi:hypothetical protein